MWAAEQDQGVSAVFLHHVENTEEVWRHTTYPWSPFLHLLSPSLLPEPPLQEYFLAAAKCDPCGEAVEIVAAAKAPVCNAGQGRGPRWGQGQFPSLPPAAPDFPCGFRP